MTVTQPHSPGTWRWMGAATVHVTVVGVMLAGALSVAPAHAQHTSPLARVEALDLDPAKVGRVTVYFTPADREHADRLAVLAEETAAYFEGEFGTSFPLHLAVLNPEDWFDPWTDGDAQAYGEPWGWVQDLLIGVPASLDEGVLIFGPDNEADLRRVQFVMLHEFGHLANKQYLHPESQRSYSSVRWFEEFLATYFAYAFVRARYPSWAEASHREWVDFIEGYSPPVLSLDWTFMGDLPAQERGPTYAWYQILLNLRVATVYEDHGLDFLRQVKSRLVWDQAGEWTTQSVLSTLEEFAPGFEAWAEELQNGDYLPRNQH
ncbi:MAG TPA: hypothetical protein VMV46_01540 [Thermoanaerobaculia bacterium]|nr:hypothetical protein [Thermoanaerobaculia bacterium]